MFLMNTLTVPKIKDLVHKPNQQYKDILDTLGGANPPDIGAELSSFLNDLKKTPSNKKNVNDFESLSNESGYSLY